MSPMTISLPESLRAYVDQQVRERGFGSSSEYVRELIRKDKERGGVRSLLMQGAASAPGPTADEDFFDELRSHIAHATRE